MKIVLALIITLTSLFGSINDIEKKISQNKKQIKTVKNKKSNINRNIKNIGETINKEEKSYKNVVSVLKRTNTKLLLNRIKLSNAITQVKKLTAKSKRLAKIKDKMEKDVIEFVVEKYSMSMAVEQIDKKSINDVLNKEVYTLAFDNTKEEITNLNISYLKVNNSIRDNEKKIKKLHKYIEEQKNIKKKYKSLEEVQEKTLESLKQKHKIYQNNLKKLISKQNKITDLLGNLNILKKKEIKAEERRIKKAKALAKKKEFERKKKEKQLAEAKRKAQVKKTKELKIKKRAKLDKEIDIEVKKIGSSAKGIKISKYRGSTTISPLKSYTVTKKFGKYYDKVYKMELFNESVALKTKKPNAKVYSVFKGQVVYAKQNSGLLENVVIVKHKNNLHTIYSHLDKISPTLKAGKWIPKGYVVGRVNDTLEFQATKNSKYIDPLKLIRKK